MPLAGATFVQFARSTKVLPLGVGVWSQSRANASQGTCLGSSSVALQAPKCIAGGVKTDYLFGRIRVGNHRVRPHRRSSTVPTFDRPMMTLVTRTAWPGRILSASDPPGGTSPEAMRRRILVPPARCDHRAEEQEGPPRQPAILMQVGLCRRPAGLESTGFSDSLLTS